MPSPDPYFIFTDRLEEIGIPYVVTGSLAAIYYGEPRMTNDVDIVAVIEKRDVPVLERAFPADLFYCPPGEVIALEAAREQRGHFNLIHHETGFKADIYLAAGDPLHRWALERATVTEIDGHTVKFAPPEYVIVRKLQFYREGGSPKHLRDIHRMVAGLGEAWLRGDLERFIEKLGLAEEWQRAIDGTGQP